MISDHFRKIDLISNRTLFLLAGGLVIVCQLVAMALVADGQVQKAQVRHSEVASQKLAFAQCVESGIYTSRQGCLLQVRTVVQQPEVLVAGVNKAFAESSYSPTMPVMSGGTAHYGNADGFAMRQVADSQAGMLQNQTPFVQGYMPTVFSAQ